MASTMRMMLVDGYNMIRRIPELLDAEGEGLESGRDRLLSCLEQYSSKTGLHIAVVFDGGGRRAPDRLEPPSEEQFAGVDIFFSRSGQSADAKIVSIVRDLKEKGRYRGMEILCDDIIIVSDDIILKEDVKALGAYAVSTTSLNLAMEQNRLPNY